MVKTARMITLQSRGTKIPTATISAKTRRPTTLHVGRITTTTRMKHNARGPTTKTAVTTSRKVNDTRRATPPAPVAAVLQNPTMLPTLKGVVAAALLANPGRPVTPAAVVIHLANPGEPVMLTALAVVLLANPGGTVMPALAEAISVANPRKLMTASRTTVDPGWSYWPCVPTVVRLLA